VLPGRLLRCFVEECEMVPVAPFIAGMSVVRFLYCRNFSASFLITFLSPEIATSISINVPFFSDYHGI